MTNTSSARYHRFKRIWPAGPLLVLIAVVWWSWVPLKVTGDTCALGGNAAWVSVDWTSQPVDPDRVRDLAQIAVQHKLRYLYPFTTYVHADGSFSPSYDHAAEFVSAFRSENKDSLLLAWIGIPLDNKGGLGVDGWVDLADSNTRRQICAFVSGLIDNAGFDGIHLDAETVRNHDPHFIVLLEEMKEAIGAESLLSISGNDWKPDLLDHAPVIGDYKWSSTYYHQVAAHVDQIATMTYDSLMPLPALYRFWLREQVKGISSALSDSDAELIVGLSVSEECTTTHMPRAENMQTGLAGICAGVSKSRRAQETVSGIAVYAAWEASEADWQAWQGVLPDK